MVICLAFLTLLSQIEVLIEKISSIGKENSQVSVSILTNS
ncbi:unnamed protein product [Acidithrix sp. C25]|nr:unnamed protein product [Acidithrix sp. C25]